MLEMNVPIKLALVASLGVILGVVGGIVLAMLPGLIKQKVTERLQLVNGSEVFVNWENPSVPVWMEFYLFNITNSADVANLGAKPILQQLGPYTYREFRKKRNITWNEDETLISYNDEKSFVFEQSRSVGSLQDLVTTINIPIVTIAKRLKGIHAYLRLTANTLLAKDGIFVTDTVNNLLFKGHKIEFIDKIQKLIKQIMLPAGKFALYKNSTSGGRFTVYTGIGNITRFGRIHSWNQANTVNFWNDEYCNRVNGSDGSTFPPFVSKKSKLFVFPSELCRSVHMIYEKETKVEGIPAYKFILPKELFISPTKNPENACYCTNPSYCAYSGILNVSVCKNDAPIFISNPHFYQASEKLIGDVIGLEPNKDEHETKLEIEPTTGIVLSASRKIQVNVEIEKILGFGITYNPSGIIYPIMWINESARITPEIANIFRSKVLASIEIGNSVSRILIGTGAIIIISVVIFGIMYYRKQSTTGRKKIIDLQSQLQDELATEALMTPISNNNENTKEEKI